MIVDHINIIADRCSQAGYFYAFHVDTKEHTMFKIMFEKTFRVFSLWFRVDISSVCSPSLWIF